MERREVGNVGEPLEFERLVEVPIDVFQDTVHPVRILETAVHGGYR